MSSELGLDPSDPLNLLLRNSSDDSDSRDNSQAWSTLSSLWSDPVPPTDPSKSYADMMPMDFSDLTSSMAMDMDFNNPMAIEPSILQFDPVKFANAFAGYDDQYGLSSDLMATQFPFSFQFNNSNGQVTGSSSGSSASDSPQSFTKERRLSVTSSSSSSGASLSPVPESLASPTTGGYVSDTQPKEEPIPLTEVPHAHDPAAELAARVRQAAGVMLAVPMGAQLQGYGAQILPNSSQAKLPIPRLSRHDSVASKSTPSSSSAASTPPPSTPPPSTLTTNPHPLRLSPTPALPSDLSAPYTPIAPTPTTTTLTTTAAARPKTSHTTIERRYRTNLNARIQSLRMAVPALRVLEDREGGNGKKIKKNLKGNVIVKGTGADSPGSATPTEAEDGTPIDVIDERGFVDGVKVARKCSKANVLGKAVEYIRVLKKRELRLKREQEGLKKLIGGLVGGAALVKEWEREWREMFGGEEKDEVEGEALDGGDDNDGEDDDEDGDEDEEEDERMRKKVKMSSGASKKASERKKAAAISPPVVASSSNSLMQSADVAAAPAEKRKRGRPRKTVPPPPVNTLPSLPVHREPEAMVQDEPAIGEQIRQPWMHPQPQQIQGGQQPQPQQYLLAVFALFSFFNSPLTPSSSSSFFGSSAHANAHTHTGTVLSAQPPLAYAPEIISQFTPPTNATQLMVNGWSWQEYVQLFHLFVSVLVLVGFVASWMGLDLGRLYSHSHSQAQQQHTKRGRSLSVRAFRASATEKDKVKTTRRLSGPKGWIKLGEESVFEGRASALSLYDRVQIYRACTSTTTTSAASSSSLSISILTSLSLILHTTPGPSALLSGLAKMKAHSVWEQAKSAARNPSHSHSLSPSEVPSKAPSVAYSLMFEEVKSVESALEMLSRAHLERTSEEEEKEKEDSALLNVLARLIVKDRVKRHLGKLFIRAVAPLPISITEDHLASEQDPQGGAGETRNAEQKGEQMEEQEQEEDKAWRRTIDAAREMGGRVEDLGRMFERVWKAPSGGVDEDEIEELVGHNRESDDNEAGARALHGGGVDVDAEIRALLVALVLYRRLFASASSHPHATTQEEEEGCITPTAQATIISSSSLLSPPPSPRTTPRPKRAKFLLEVEAGQGADAAEEDEEDKEDDDNEDEDEEAKSAAVEKKRMLFMLRTVLGSRVFEQSEQEGSGSVAGEGEGDGKVGLEDAKDRVVDLIVDAERREKAKRGSSSPLLV